MDPQEEEEETPREETERERYNRLLEKTLVEYAEAFEILKDM